MKKSFKILLGIILFLAICIGALFYFISPIAKYVVEKNSINWTGRKITISKLKIHPFDGAIYIKDIKIYEANSDSTFFSCHDVYLKVSLGKILAKEYEIDEIKIDQPEISISQNGNKFNFDDLLKRFLPGPDKNKDTTVKAPDTHYYVTKVIINNGNITYNNVPIHNIIRVHNINFNLPEISWNKPESNLHLDFEYGTGGFFNIDLKANRKTFDYSLALSIDTYDLSQYYAPLKNYVRISSLSGSLTSKLNMSGKFNNPKEFSLSGFLNINKVEVKDPEQKKLFALGELSISVDTINVKKSQYIFHHIFVDKLYMILNEHDKGTNFSEIIKQEAVREQKAKDSVRGKSKVDYSNIITLVSSSISAMAVNFLSSNYHTDSLALRKGEFVFNDNTMANRFHYVVSNINIATDEIGPKNKSVLFKASATLNDTGKFDMAANLNFDLKKKTFNYKITTLGLKHISPIAKYLIEKYDVKYLGREVAIKGIKINALDGSVKIKGLKIYEANSDKVFLGCNTVFVKVDLPKLFNGTYAIDSVLFDQPEISIMQDGNKFNFDDLKARFKSTDTTQDTTPSKPIPYEVDNVIINKGHVVYNNVPIHNVFNLHDINFNLPQLIWNNPQTNAHLDFQYGTGGFFNIDMGANLNTKAYSLALEIDDYDISQYYAPVNSFLAISSLKGKLNTKLNIYGNFNDPKDFSTLGFIRVNDFELNDTNKQKVFGMGELYVDIDTVNVKHNIYSINNILMDKPFIRFDYYTAGNNISNMIKYTSPPGPVTDNNTGEVKPDFSNLFTLISSSIKMMAVDFFTTDYHTDSITIRNGQLLFSDYTLNRPFHYNVSKLNLVTDEISAKSKNIVFNASATLADTGKATMYADISIDLKNMLINYNITNFRLTDINPYMEYYVATPFTDGYMNYQSTDSVINRNLKSTNIIHINHIEVGKKMQTKSEYNVPMKLAIGLLKDDKGNIDLNLPANGNLDDPNYKVGKIIWPMLTDLIKKTAESPVKILAKIFSKNPEDISQLEFEYMQEKFAEKQKRKLEDVSKVLEKKKELQVEITQIIDSLEEKDELAISLAKQKYFDETNHTVNDSLLTRHKRKKVAKAENKIAAQDTLFEKYLNKKLNLTGNELITLEEKCIRLTGDSILNMQVHRIMEARNQEIMDYLINKKSIAKDRVKVVINKNTSQLNNSDQPQFKINYSAGDNHP